MDFDDVLKLSTVVCLFLIFISTACIAGYLEEIFASIIEPTGNCIVVNEEIYCK